MVAKRKHYVRKKIKFFIKSIPVDERFGTLKAYKQKRPVKTGQLHSTYGIKYRLYNITYDEYLEIQGMPPRLSKRLK